VTIAERSKARTLLTLINEQKADQRLRYSGIEVTIGRIQGNDLVLPVAHISSRHARIMRRGQQWVISDLGSTNGSCVLRSGKRLLLGPRGAAEIVLERGDVLLLGDIDAPERWRVEIQYLATAEQRIVEETVVRSREAKETMASHRRLESSSPLLPAFLQLAEALTKSQDREAILDRIVQTALEIVKGAVDVLAVQIDRTEKLSVLARAQRGGGISGHPNEEICRRAMQSETALLFGLHSDAFPAHTLVQQGLGNGIAAPLLTADGALGVLQINCDSKQPMLDEQALDIAIVLAHHASLALQKASLIAQLQRASQRLREENAFLKRETGPSGLIAESPAMQRVVSEVDKAAATDVTVLLSGETGTGKEVFAREVHRRSRRHERLMVPVNCGALTETLLDSELFGHKKGAFTGADQDRKGVFEMAHGGTVFLDEIGETPQSLQVRLLRVLEEGKIKRVGEAVERNVDVRVITATNRDLAKMVEDGRFRQDLYYRLRVFPIHLPPLRERVEDIGPLCRATAHRLALRMGKAIGEVDESLVEALARYPFPGNVRELVNEMERAVVRADPGQSLTAELLSEEILSAPAHHIDPNTGSLLNGAQARSLREQLAAFEREVIRACLARHSGRRVPAAKELGLTRQGLAKKMARLGIE
jgi:transcriptional regulator with GAF, ATPase, and Fis domain